MEIFYYKKLDSTQLEAKRVLKSGRSGSFCIIADVQTNGVGSRDNSWQSKEGDLTFSFVLDKAMLPKDLHLSSISIYFACIFKSILLKYNQDIWVKWPNDLYKNDKKVGGVVTNIINHHIICGIGLNINKNSEYGYVDIDTKKDDIVHFFLKELNKFPKWKQIFRNFSVEFEKSLRYGFHVGSKKVTSKSVILDFDGSLIIDGKRVYSLR